jgi:hypothetical protein
VPDVYYFPPNNQTHPVRYDSNDETGNGIGRLGRPAEFSQIGVDSFPPKKLIVATGVDFCNSGRGNEDALHQGAVGTPRIAGE